MPILEFESLQRVFPRLPSDANESRVGWREIDERTGIRTSYRWDNGEIEARYEGPLERVAVGEFTVRFRLAPDTRLPTSIRTSGYWKGYKETADHWLSLKQTIRHDAAWANAFRSDAVRYFAAAAGYRRGLGQNVIPLAVATREDKAKANAILDHARAQLTAARAEVSNPLFRENLDLKIQQADRFRASRLKIAERFAKLAQMPAPAWKVADLSGKEHSLESCRGKVVVLDFWFRQCSFCMRAAPQIDFAAAHFADRKAPVLFFGVGTDKDVADSKHVADALGLRYPVLPSKKMADDLGIETFPTVVVMDLAGKVHGVFVGYHPALREEIIRCVSDCLPPSQGG